jgi:hypothetical protein
MRFKEWGDYFVSGVWTTTNAREKSEEIRCEWILDKSFIGRVELPGFGPEQGRADVH